VEHPTVYIQKSCISFLERREGGGGSNYSDTGYLLLVGLFKKERNCQAKRNSRKSTVSLVRFSSDPLIVEKEVIEVSVLWIIFGFPKK